MSSRHIERPLQNNTTNCKHLVHSTPINYLPPPLRVTAVVAGFDGAVAQELQDLAGGVDGPWYQVGNAAALQTIVTQITDEVCVEGEPDKTSLHCNGAILEATDNGILLYFSDIVCCKSRSCENVDSISVLIFFYSLSIILHTITI